jgi:Fuc2NAc and GlcNAc transferase
MNLLHGLIAFVLAIVLTYGIRKIALNRSILDIPNERSSHTSPVPRGGGLSIITIWYGFLFYFQSTGRITESFFYANLAGLIIVAIGIADDIVRLRPGIRFFFQCLASALAVGALGGIEQIYLGFYNYQEPITLHILSFIGILWAINLFNFLDGIDGFIGMETAFVALAAFALFQDTLFIILAGASLGFLVLNWHPAKIFMGDVGSTYLGFLLAIIAIYHNNMTEGNILIWFILTAVFWFDATVTLFRRLAHGEKLTVAHRKHAYQRIVQYGLSHQKTTLFTLLINITLFVPLAAVYYYGYYQFIPLVLILDLGLLYRILKYIDRKKSFQEA